MTRFFPWTTVLLLCFGLPATGLPAVGAAQQIVVATRTPRFLLPAASRGAPPVQVDAARIPVLRRKVSLDVAGLRFEDALAAVARQADAKLVYVKSLLPLDSIVQFRSDSITVAAALTELLFGLQIDVLVEGAKQIVLVRSSAYRAMTGGIVGRVTDSTSGRGVANADVFLDGTRWRTATDSSGGYRLVEIDAGTYTLIVRRLGYAKQSRSVTVVEGRTDTVHLALTPVVTRLEEVVTTATGRQRRVELGNDITRINADSIVRTEPVHSVTELLETRVPGLSVQHTSGAPGDPARLRLRGAASPLRSNDPIVIVDGVRIYAEQSAGRSRNLARPPGDSGFSYTYATPSPLDYLDPNSIETIEVIKGPSAATLYGQDAANGVIVITTKKGRAGPPRWTASADHGVTQIAGRYPDLLLRWGHPLDSDRPVACPVNQTIAAGADAASCEADSLVSFQLLNDPALTVLDQGQRTGVTLGVSGGTSALTYAVTGSYQDHTGLPKLPAYEMDRYQARVGSAPPNWMQRPQHLRSWSVTSAITARLGAKADVTLSTHLARQVQQRSSLETQLGRLMSTYLDRASGTYYTQQGTPTTSLRLGVANGDFSYFERATDAALTLTPSLNLTWRPRTWLTVTSDAGLNMVQRSDQIFLPRGAAEGAAGISDSTGAVSYGHGTSLVSTFNVRGNATAPLGRGFRFQFAAGANYTGTAIRDLSTQTRNLPIGTSLIGGEIEGVQPSVLDDATFGWYVQPAVNNDRLFLNLGLQLAGGKAYGGSVTLPTFPKLGFSYLVSDESFYPLKTIIPTLRLRLAYGRAGRQPGVTDRLRLYTVPQSVWEHGTLVTGAFLRTLGNEAVRPERTTEVEGGFDADLLADRLHVTVTGYRKTTEDALLNVPVAPSVYGNFYPAVQELRNIGVLRNTGLELTVGTQLLRSSLVTWGAQLGLAQNRNVVVRLGPGVEPFYTSGNSTAGGLRVAPGYPLFGRWAQPILGYADGNGNGVIDQSEILVGDTAVYVGATLPNYEANLSTTLSVLGGAVALSAALQYQDGLSQFNGVAQQLVIFSRGWNDPTTPVAEQVATSTVTDYNWMQTVNTVRFHSLALSYRVPPAAARRVGAQTLSLALQGTNLGLWTNYRGLDPNVNAFGTGNNVTDTGVLPLPRSWQVRVNATY